MTKMRQNKTQTVTVFIFNLIELNIFLCSIYIFTMHKEGGALGEAGGQIKVGPSQMVFKILPITLNAIKFQKYVIFPKFLGTTLLKIPIKLPAPSP